MSTETQARPSVRERFERDTAAHIDGPLYSATYQRHGEGSWVLVERGEGFA